MSFAAQHAHIPYLYTKWWWNECEILYVCTSVLISLCSRRDVPPHAHFFSFFLIGSNGDRMLGCCYFIFWLSWTSKQWQVRKFLCMREARGGEKMIKVAASCENWIHNGFPFGCLLMKMRQKNERTENTTRYLSVRVRVRVSVLLSSSATQIITCIQKIKWWIHSLQPPPLRQCFPVDTERVKGKQKRNAFHVCVNSKASDKVNNIFFSTRRVYICEAITIERLILKHFISFGVHREHVVLFFCLFRRVRCTFLCEFLSLMLELILSSMFSPHSFFLYYKCNGKGFCRLSWLTHFSILLSFFCDHFFTISLFRLIFFCKSLSNVVVLLPFFWVQKAFWWEYLDKSEKRYRHGDIFPRKQKKNWKFSTAPKLESK